MTKKKNLKLRWLHAYEVEYVPSLLNFEDVTDFSFCTDHTEQQMSI